MRVGISNLVMLMKKRIPLQLTILILLLTGIIVYALSAVFFTKLDNVVHGDLYRYGLQFDYEWAGQYWTYSRLIIGNLTIAIIATGISMAFFQIKARTRQTDLTRFVNCLFLVVGIITTGLAAFFFNRLDYLIHNDLYVYGLQFSYEWALQYWAYAKLILGLFGLGTAALIISIALILLSSHARVTQLSLRVHALLKIDPAKLICFLLFSVGGIALAFSLSNASSTLAFIGLGLVFWGAILFTARPRKYIEENLLDMTTLPLLANLEKMLRELGYSGKGVYLPPKYLKDSESSLVFIQSKAEKTLPKPNEVDAQVVKSGNQGGMFLTPSGAPLSKLFEDKLGTSFLRKDLNYLQEKLPKLLIEDLEIAEDLDVKTENDTVKINITNHIFNEICQETRKLQKTHECIGCTLCSAIACALAKATGKAIAINKEEQSQDGKTTRIQYQILEP